MILCPFSLPSAITTHLPRIHRIDTLFCSWSFKWTFCKRFATKIMYEFCVFPMHFRCPVHCYVVDFVVLTLLVDCCKRLTLLVWNGLNCSLPSSLLWFKYFPKHCVSPLLVPGLKILGLLHHLPPKPPSFGAQLNNGTVLPCLTLSYPCFQSFVLYVFPPQIKITYSYPYRTTDKIILFISWSSLFWEVDSLMLHAT